MSFLSAVPAESTKSFPKTTLPWYRVYAKDELTDSKLSRCSLAAQGLWARLKNLMHLGEVYGHLILTENPQEWQVDFRENYGKSTVDFREPSQKKRSIFYTISRSLGRDFPKDRRVIERGLMELYKAGVLSINSDGIIYCRRMLQDQVERSETGKRAADYRWHHSKTQPENPPENEPKSSGENLPASDAYAESDTDTEHPPTPFKGGGSPSPRNFAERKRRITKIQAQSKIGESRGLGEGPGPLELWRAEYLGAGGDPESMHQAFMTTQGERGRIAGYVAQHPPTTSPG